MQQPQEDETPRIIKVRKVPRNRPAPERPWVAEDRREIARETWLEFLEMLQEATETMK